MICILITLLNDIQLYKQQQQQQQKAYKWIIAESALKL